jgi:hypothetical protein
MRALQDKPGGQLKEIGINGGKYKDVQRIAKHFVKERLISAGIPSTVQLA